MDGGWGRGGQKIALRIVFIGLVISFGGGGGEGRGETDGNLLLS